MDIILVERLNRKDVKKINQNEFSALLTLRGFSIDQTHILEYVICDIGFQKRKHTA